MENVENPSNMSGCDVANILMDPCLSLRFPLPTVGPAGAEIFGRRFGGVAIGGLHTLFVLCGAEVKYCQSHS